MEGQQVSLSSLPVREAASKAIEVILYGEYVYMLEPGKYQFQGTFEEYLNENYGNSDRIFNADPAVKYDTTRLWEHVKYEARVGNYDGLTAKREAEYGGEGDGDAYWAVISVTDGLTTRYFRRDGWYASYNGGELDGDTYEVTPQERLVVFYE